MIWSRIWITVWCCCCRTGRLRRITPLTLRNGFRSARGSPLSFCTVPTIMRYSMRCANALPRAACRWWPPVTCTCTCVRVNRCRTRSPPYALTPQLLRRAMRCSPTLNGICVDARRWRAFIRQSCWPRRSALRICAISHSTFYATSIRTN